MDPEREGGSVGILRVDIHRILAVAILINEYEELIRFGEFCQRTPHLIIDLHQIKDVLFVSRSVWIVNGIFGEMDVPKVEPAFRTS